MRRFILSLSGKLQALCVIGLTIVIAFASAFFCSLFFDEHQLVVNTDLISAVYEVMGTMYAILLTFTLWGVWQNFTEAGKSVQIEAYALLDLVHMLETFSVDKKEDIQRAVLAYAYFVIEKEWPLLKNFSGDLSDLRRHDHLASKEITQVVESMTATNERENVVFSQSLSLLVRWLDARRSRLLIARGDTARALWPLLFTGAFVLFAFHGLFVAKTILIWITLLFGTSLVVGVTFFLIYTLDYPFIGSLSIDAEPFALTIQCLKQGK